MLDSFARPFVTRLGDLTLLDLLQALFTMALVLALGAAVIWVLWRAIRVILLEMRAAVLENERKRSQPPAWRNKRTDR